MSSADDERTERTGRDDAPAAGETPDPTLRAEVDERAAIARDDTRADADEAPEPPGPSPREEMKTAGTDEDVAVADAGETEAPTGEAGAPPTDRRAAEPPPPDASPAHPEGEGTASEAGEGEAAPAVAADQPEAESAAAEEPAPATADAPATDAPAEAAAEVEAEAQEEPGPTPGEADPLRQGVLERLVTALGDDLVESHLEPGVDLWVRVRYDAWQRAGLACRDDLGMALFTFLSAIDWMPSPFGRGEDGTVADAEADGDGARRPGGGAYTSGVAGGDSRLQLLARVCSPTQHVGVTLKADLPDDEPRVDTWSTVYAGADWHERETWEMFGIDFVGHRYLTHIYLPGDFEGHPLRKDFPLLAREVKPWPGIVDVEPMPGEAAGDEQPAEGSEA